MKRLYMAFAAILAGGMISVGGNVVNAQKITKQVKRPKMALVQKRTAATSAFVPQTEETYGWGGTEWVLSSKSMMKYENFLLQEKTSDIYNDGALMFSTKDIHKYNEDNKLCEIITQGSYDGGTTWENEMREVKDYDKIRKDQQILDEFYMWDFSTNEWYLDTENEEGFFLDIERDEFDRVSKSTRWLNSTKPIALVSQEFKYGSMAQGQENHATSMNWHALNDNYELVPSYIYEDMVWQESDGQYLNILPNVYYAFDNDANNKLVGYTLYYANADGTRGEMDASYKSAYDEQGRLYYVEINFGDGGQYQCVYKLDQDANGSYEYNEILSGDFDGNGSIDFPNEYIMNTTVVTCDSYGEIIKEEMYDVDATLQKTLREGYGYETVYNEDGQMTELTLTYYTTLVEGGSWENLTKFKYSDFTDGTTTDINSADARTDVAIRDNTLYFSNSRGAHYIITDISGKTYGHGIVTNDKVRLDNMPEGMYIVKISGKNCNNAVKLLKK